MSTNLTNQLHGPPQLSPEPRNELRKAPKTSLGAPPTLPRAPQTLPTTPNELPDASPSSPKGAQPPLPGALGNSPVLEKPMFSLRKTMNFHFSALPSPRPPRSRKIGLIVCGTTPSPLPPNLFFRTCLFELCFFHTSLRPPRRVPPGVGGLNGLAPTAADPGERNCSQRV